MATFATVQDRYVSASFVRKTPQGALFFALDREVSGSTQAAVNSTTGFFETLAIGQETNIFLERLTGAGRWIASLTPPSLNPWIQNTTPEVGRAVFGTVVRYRDQHAAIIRFSHGGTELEAELDRKTLPLPFQAREVQDSVFMGDYLGGLVTSVDFKKLEIQLDLSQWLELQRKAWKYIRRDQSKGLGPLIERNKQNIKTPEKISMTLHGTSCIIIDDDKSVTNTLQELFSAQGANVSTALVTEATSTTDLVTTIDKHNGIIVVDYQLSNDVAVNEAILNAVQRHREKSKQCNVLLYTGNNTKSNNFAHEKGFGFLLKPALSSELIQWLQTPIEASKRNISEASRKKSNIFAVETKTIQIIHKANELLDRMVQKYEMSGAFWVVELAPERFELRAYSQELGGKLTSQLMTELSRSIVGRALATKESISARLPKRDPIYNILGEGHGFALAHPVLIEGHAPRCIVFLSTKEIVQDVQKRISDRKDHFELLIDAISQAETIDEIAAAAEQGRLALATLHELRSELNSILGIDFDEIEFADLVELLNDSAPRIQSLVHEQLRDFRPMVQEELGVNEAVAKVVTRIGRYLRDSKDLEHVNLECHLAAELSDLKIKINPIVIERALSNLIDNAAHFVQKEPFKKIWVRTVKVNSDIDTPVHIIVEDTGPGVSVVDRERLFMPRSTGRPDSSTGYGLFITSQFLNSVGGKVVCDQRPRWGGASFRVCLPITVG